MKEIKERYSKFKEGYWHCSSFWICPEDCSGVAKEKWNQFECHHYTMIDGKTKEVKLKSEPITYFEHLMRKKINDGE